MSQITKLIELAMNPKCAANVIAMMCHAAFKECTEVVDVSHPTGSRWVPSLLCRSECERHHALWERCVDDLRADPDVKETFDAQMLALVSLTVSNFIAVLNFRLLAVGISIIWGVRFTDDKMLENADEKSCFDLKTMFCIMNKTGGRHPRVHQ
jgi:hypothetical protein